MNNLLIIGAGQYGMVAKEIAESTGEYDKIAFLDDNNPAAIGKISDYANFRSEYDYAVVAVGNSDFRLSFINKLFNAGYKIPKLIHARAYVSPSAKIGMGCFVEPMAVVHTDVTIMSGCIISAGVIINHNSVIEEGCHINCGSIVKSGVQVAAGTRSGYGDLFDNDYHHGSLAV
ncbi:MAG: PglB [Ruminococcus sp.]|uniref:PglD-related sugar-binding protein n=1 Tax=Ruminococcus sp. TaxID=41978 RepID=UPI0025F4EB8D|nr:PglB [Ruminococcus sp.]MBR5682086.1 PglB [Ruminococcus sp.]